MAFTQAQAEYERLAKLATGPDRADDHWKLPARRIVEFWCRKHLLGVIYETPSGPLFVSSARYLSTKKFRSKWTQHAARLPGNPSPRLPFLDEPFSDTPAPLNCRCGQWPSLTREILQSVIETQKATGAMIKLGVSETELHSAGGTLCWKL